MANTTKPATVTEVAAQRFQSDVADHELTVLRDDGLYRHLRCARPGTGSYWFEVVTWPGALAIRGDMGDGYLFSRLDDMLQFFRSPNRGINPQYWAEKLRQGCRNVEVYSEDVLRAQLDDALAEYQEGYPQREAGHAAEKTAYLNAPMLERWPWTDGPRDPGELKTPDEVRELISDYEMDGMLAGDTGARMLLNELEKAGVVAETWEWKLTDWDYHYLWACHAIVWAISQYDRAKASAAAAAVSG